MSEAHAAPEQPFSLVQDPFLRFLRLVRIAPPGGLGTARRAIGLVIVTLAPILVWAAVNGYIPPSRWQDSMLRHLGVLGRGLVGLPLFVIAEPIAESILARIIGNFVPSGLIAPADLPRFKAILASVARLRDAWYVWIALLAITVFSAMTTGSRPDLMDPDTIHWSADTQGLEFGTQWALFVVRPLYLFYGLVWLWRLSLCWILFRRISRLNLQLVPSHPDRVGGLGFIESLPIGFWPVLMSLSFVFCAFVAHQIRAHGMKFADFQTGLIALGIVLMALFASPLLAFGRPLRRIRIRARMDYGTLAARQVRGIHARWVEGKPVEDEAILSAPEIGPAADMSTLYSMGTAMRTVPMSRTTLLMLAWPVLVPILLVYTLEVPIKDILMKVLGALT